MQHKCAAAQKQEMILYNNSLACMLDVVQHMQTPAAWLRCAAKLSACV
jgi:hypothetical protein